MPRPTREQILEDLQGLTPEQQQQYVDQLDKQFPESAPALSRFSENFMRTAVPTESFKAMGKAAVDPLGGLITTDEDGKVSLGLPNVAKLYRDVATGAATGAADQFQKAGGLRGLAELVGLVPGAGPTPEQAGHMAAAALPLVGPAAAEAGEQIAEGDVAGGLGKGAGLIAPMLATRAPEVAGTRMASHLEKAASENIAKAVAGSASNYVPKVVKNARELSENLGASPVHGVSLRTMLEKVKGPEALEGGPPSSDSLLGQATSELNKTKEAIAAENKPIDIEGIQNAVGERFPKLETPEGAPTSAPESLHTAQAEAVNKMTGMLQREREAHGVSTGPQQRLVMDPNTKILTLETSPSEIIPGEVPAGEVLKMRTQAGDLSKFNTSPLTEPSPAAAVGSYTQKLLSDKLHSLYPELKNVDEQFSLYNTVGDLLQARAQSGLGARPGAVKTVAARAALEAGISPLGLISGKAGSAYGAYQVAKEILNSPVWHTMRASQRYALADAIRNGNIGLAQRLLASAGAANTAAGAAIDQNPPSAP